MDWSFLVTCQKPQEQGDPDESENDEDDEESSIAEGEDREKPKQKAATKSELYKMYAGKTPIAMFTEFMMDRSLRDAAVLITEVVDPLENKYVSDLKAQKGGFESMLQWSVERASGRPWCQTAVDLIAKALSYELVNKVNMVGFCKPPMDANVHVQWVSDPQLSSLVYVLVAGACFWSILSQIRTQISQILSKIVELCFALRAHC